MGALDWLAGKLGYVRPRARASSVGYAAAEISRLTASLRAETEFINTTLRWQLRTLRARSRQAKQNNPFARRFVRMAVSNIAGPMPFRLQAKVKFKSGGLDTTANRLIESEWCYWGRKGGCEVTGRYSLNAVLRLLVDTLATDGELLFRKLRGPEYGRHGYALQLVDIDRLDEMKNASLANGGAIHMGVEVDANSKPVNYHLLKRKPSQWATQAYQRDYEVVPAADIEHIFIPEFAEQIRGVPWMYAALLNLVHLGAFEEAAVIAARIGASQMGVIESPDGGKTLADWAGAAPKGDGTDDVGGVRGDPQITAEPGAFPVLPPGYKISEGWDPKYPDAAIGPFIKAMLRGVSVGVDVAYHNLSGDMEGVNYSSARIAELDERDGWMMIQSFLAEHLLQPLYEDWLRMQFLTGSLPFEIAKFDKYRDVYWQARRWGWVDPRSEVEASIAAIDARLKSRTRIIAEGGEDIEDVFGEIAEEEKLAATMKVKLPSNEPAKPQGQPEAAGGQANGGESGKSLLELAAEVVKSMPAPVFHNTVNVAAPVVTVPEREVIINNDLTVPERAVTVNNDVTVPERAVTVKNNVKAFPNKTVETIERDKRGEIQKITREAVDG